MLLTDMALVLSLLRNSFDIRRLGISRFSSGHRQPLPGLLSARLLSLSQSVDRIVQRTTV